MTYRPEPHVDGGEFDPDDFHYDLRKRLADDVRGVRVFAQYGGRVRHRNVARRWKQQHLYGRRRRRPVVAHHRRDCACSPRRRASPEQLEPPLPNPCPKRAGVFPCPQSCRHVPVLGRFDAAGRGLAGSIASSLTSKEKSMPYIPANIANNLLSRAFRDHIPVSPMKLQKSLFFVASEYQKTTRRVLLEEPFSTWAYGPVLYSVHNKLRCFGRGAPIDRYIRDAKNRVYIINEGGDVELSVALDKVWAWTKHLPATTLAEYTQHPGSAWDRAFQRGDLVLDPDDIAADTTYRRCLGLVTV